MDLIDGRADRNADWIRHKFTRNRKPPRQIRSTSYATQSYTEDPTGFGTKITTISDNSAQKLVDRIAEQSSEPSSKTDGDSDVVVAVRVSSSVGRPSVKRIPAKKTAPTKNEDGIPSQNQNTIASEETPSLVAEANKSEFSVDESEPITSISDMPSKDYGQEYPADIRVLPSYSTPEYEDASRDKLQPVQHGTVIYHNNPREPARGRSVSYSAVIQTLPQQGKAWEEGKHEQLLDRQERHYDNSQTPYANSYGGFQELPKSANVFNETQMASINSGSMAETKDHYVTSKYNPPEYNESTEKSLNNENPWRKTAEPYKNVEPTERNWEVQDKSYPPRIQNSPAKLPTVYGQPEQNYEVDESVSLMTNGRTHGIQDLKGTRQKVPSATPALDSKNVESTTDANGQKVGYVVEGRNYRKYRVEERTSDGFIVGEYGVVSHNDGTLRGVRYTADGTINPRLIYDALMKFLSL